MTTITEVATYCPECGEIETEQGKCLNVNCARAVRQATAAASRDTAKATATMTTGPAAWTQSGGVD